MEVHLTPEKEAQLAELATRSGKNAAQLIEDAITRFLEDDARFRAAVREGFAAIDRGEYLDEEEMDARVAQMLQS